MKITETCGCGAKFDVESDYARITDAVTIWREGHRHIEPELTKPGIPDLDQRILREVFRCCDRVEVGILKAVTRSTGVARKAER